MTYIIAEIGNNHEGESDRLFHLVQQAAECGADAVKFQIFNPETLVTVDAPAMVGEGTQRERLARLRLSSDVYMEASQDARRRGLEVVITFLDVVLLQEYWRLADRLKIASGDITHIELIRAANETGLPVILSTGVARDAEIEQALHSVAHGRRTLLHCVSEYPCPPEKASLDRMTELREGFCSSVGYSDHCCGIEACVAAAAMGAEIIEKHFTDQWRGMDKTGGALQGPVGDHRHGATPEQLTTLVSRIRQIEQMREVCYTPTAEKRKAMMRGAYAAQDIASGTTLGEDSMVALRPAEGRSPWTLRGSRAQADYREGEAIR